MPKQTLPIQNTRKGFLALLASGFVLACFGLLARVLSQFLGHYIQVGVRMIVAIFIVLPYLAIKKVSLKPKFDNLPLFAIFIFSFPIYIIFFVISVNTAKVANAFFYLFLSCILSSYVIGYLFFKERLSVQKIVVAVLLALGLVFLIYPFDFGRGMLGIGSGLTGGVFWGISNATRKFYVDKLDRYLVIFYHMLVGAIIVFVLGFVFNEFESAVWEFRSLALSFVFGIGMVVSQTLLFFGFKNFNLNLGSIVLASQLVFVQVLGILFLKEFPTIAEMFGMISVSVAIVLSNVDLKVFNNWLVQ